MFTNAPLDLGKKKKKKKVAKDDDEFTAKLAALDVNDEQEGDAAAQESVQDGDMKQGTGIWQHGNTTPISYSNLLVRWKNSPKL